ncbi:putative zinc finger protein CONSTANS-LIKE 10-like [Capsicum annuum]|nr:putative zinc finger protein CONSTANS-LIKE 10-like [Capsicum annuum]
MRSEKMTFIQLIILVESAHHAITYLGQLGLLQLRDNRYLQCIEDLRQTLPEDRRDLPLSQEQNERMHAVGDTSRYGYAYGFPQRTFREFYLKLEGLGSFQDDESSDMILALKKQIAVVSKEAKASQVREWQRDIQYAGMKAQFDALLASGDSPLSR